MSWRQPEYLGGRRYRMHVKWWHPDLWSWCFRWALKCEVGILASLYFTLRVVVSFAKKRKS